MRQDKADKAINKLKNHWKKDIQKATNQEELNVLNDRINELNYGNLPPKKKQVFLEELQKNQRVKI
ncbi:2840_t:CDS:2 [Racocetra fulgida]|uniref:2840_t:CDS:1 n=1 Tax=Racocetra fulgida TaxID=60492 RepID=A0A9N8YUU1_9GLOM|nr:2840_t:CDS:2 [Racocetra fulgida]